MSFVLLWLGLRHLYLRVLQGVFVQNQTKCIRRPLLRLRYELVGHLREILIRVVLRNVHVRREICSMGDGKRRKTVPVLIPNRIGIACPYFSATIHGIGELHTCCLVGLYGSLIVGLEPLEMVAGDLKIVLVLQARAIQLLI